MNKGLTQLEAVLLIAVVLLVAFAIWLMTYQSPAVTFRVEGNSLYYHIENGRIGMQCTNDKGLTVIGQSHLRELFYGPIDKIYVSNMKLYPHSHVFSITCTNYYGLSPVAAATYKSP